MATSRYRTKSIFNFDDEYGNDPIIARYGVTPTRARSYELDAKLANADFLDAQTERINAEADLAQAQAEEEAKLAPLKAVSEKFRVINDLTSQRSKLEEDARRRTAEANINELLPKATSSMEVDRFVAENPDVVLNPAYMERIGYAKRKFVERDKADLRTKLPSVMSPEEVDKWELWAAERQLLGDAEVKTMLDIWRGVATKKSAAMKGLEQLGAQAMPVTPKGEFDVERAANIVEDAADARGSQDIRLLENIRKGLQQRLDAEVDPTSETALAIQDQLADVNSRMYEAATSNDSQRLRSAARASEGLKALGAEAPADWADDIIYGGGAPKPTAGPTAPKPTDTPAAPKSEAPIAPAKSEPDSRVTEADKAVEAAREETGLAKQPFGIRQINEAFSADNSDVREKAAKAKAVRKKIDPYADADLRDPQSIQNALSIVYPEIGEGTNRFDVGNSNDPRVAMAAEYLQRIDPALLKIIAASPGQGGRRGNLTFEELPELAKRAAALRSKVRTGAPRGSRE